MGVRRRKAGARGRRGRPYSCVPCLGMLKGMCCLLDVQRGHRLYTYSTTTNAGPPCAVRLVSSPMLLLYGTTVPHRASEAFLVGSQPNLDVSAWCVHGVLETFELCFHFGKVVGKAATAAGMTMHHVNPLLCRSVRFQVSSLYAWVCLTKRNWRHQLDLNTHAVLWH